MTDMFNGRGGLSIPYRNAVAGEGWPPLNLLHLLELF